MHTRYQIPAPTQKDIQAIMQFQLKASGTLYSLWGSSMSTASNLSQRDCAIKKINHSGVPAESFVDDENRCACK